jgi:hypothetical protein
MYTDSKIYSLSRVDERLGLKTPQQPEKIKVLKPTKRRGFE